MRILMISGSVRKGSFNSKLVSLLAPLVEKGGATVTVASLDELSMPFYDGDQEEASGLPENAKKFKALLREHDLVVFATPEYNGFFPGLLKNAIDWASRAEEGEKPSEVFAGKAAAIASASPGGYGGQRAQGALRTLLTNVGCVVKADTLAVGTAHTAFEGELSAELQAKFDAFAAHLLEA
jgi:chromate reductase, NAD(P)H dehydrogenase (quinone)